jgi:hypothetical protein
MGFISDIQLGLQQHLCGEQMFLTIGKIYRLTGRQRRAGTFARRSARHARSARSEVA